MTRTVSIHFSITVSVHNLLEDPVYCNFRFLGWITCALIKGDVFVWCSFIIERICWTGLFMPWCLLFRLFNSGCRASLPCSPWNPMPNPHLLIRGTTWSSRKWCFGNFILALPEFNSSYNHRIHLLGLSASHQEELNISQASYSKQNKVNCFTRPQFQWKYNDQR